MLYLIYYTLNSAAFQQLCAEPVLAYFDDKRPRPYPFACRGDGIEIVYSAIARVPAVQRVARRAVGALGDRLVELPVIQAGERAGLVDNSGDGIWERRMLHPVEDDRADRDLPLIGFAARLGGNKPREQVDVPRPAA